MAVVQIGTGWPVESTTGAVAVTTATTGAKMVNGFLVSPDGKLVIVYG